MHCTNYILYTLFYINSGCQQACLFSDDQCIICSFLETGQECGVSDFGINSFRQENEFSAKGQNVNKPVA